jgi:hypothetical protein
MATYNHCFNSELMHKNSNMSIVSLVATDPNCTRTCVYARKYHGFCDSSEPSVFEFSRDVGRADLTCASRDLKLQVMKK